MHIKARSAHPAYPARFPVPDNLVSWGSPFVQYDPVEFTADVVLVNDRTVNPKGWADPIDVSPENLMKRFSHEGPITIADGKPRNPVGRTGMKGRGLLGNWGPNHAADPMVTRWNVKKQCLEMVVIQRKDTHEWAIPGGMVDAGEQVSATLKREFGEEAMGILPAARVEFRKQLDELFKNDGVPIYRGYVDDPRNTDNAWMETTAVWFHCPDAVGEGLNLSAADDAMDVRWLALDPEGPLPNLYASHCDFVSSMLQRWKDKKKSTVDTSNITQRIAELQQRFKISEDSKVKESAVAEGVRLYDELLTKQPDNSALILKKAYFLFDCKQLQAAVNTCSPMVQKLQADSDNPHEHCAMGLALIGDSCRIQHQSHDAMKAYRESTKVCFALIRRLKKQVGEGQDRHDDGSETIARLTKELEEAKHALISQNWNKRSYSSEPLTAASLASVGTRGDHSYGESLSEDVTFALSQLPNEYRLRLETLRVAIIGEIDTLTRNNKKLQEDLEVVKAQHQEVHSQKSHDMIAAASMSAEIESIRHEKLLLEEKVKALTEEISLSQSEDHSEMNELERENRELRLRLKEIEAMQQPSESVEQLRERINNLSADLGEWEATVGRLEAEIADLKAERARLQAELTATIPQDEDPGPATDRSRNSRSKGHERTKSSASQGTPRQAQVGARVLQPTSAWLSYEMARQSSMNSRKGGRITVIK